MAEPGKCPVPGCGAECQRGKLMCRPCWFSVPGKLRRAVNDSWRAYRRQDGQLRAERRAGGIITCRPEDIIVAISTYRAAAASAIGAAMEARP